MTPPAPCCMECGAALPPDFPALLCAECLWGGNPEVPTPRPRGMTAGVAAMRVPGHDLLEEIARGGMGVVYRAREQGTHRTVALKMLRPRLADEPGMRERFRLEARSVAALDHPSILPVYRVDEAEDMPFFTMKLAAGGTLADRRNSLHGQWREIAMLFAGLADAVHYAHLHGVLHRDLKPQNVLFDDTGKSYVADFGLVKLIDSIGGLTATRDFLGTPHYSAPEVAEAHAGAATVASDVWSLGVMFYELLAERLPFEAPGIPALLKRIVEQPAPPLPEAVPRDLRVICLKCLAKPPASRYQSAAGLADDLRRWLDGRTILARPAGWVERCWTQARRNPALTMLSLALLAALLTASGAVIRESRASRDAQWISGQAAAASRTQEAKALLAEARAKRMSGSFLSRESALAALQRSWTLDPRPEVRDELLSLLALPSVERQPGPLPYATFRGWSPRPDGDLKRYVLLTEQGCSIRNFLTRREEYLIPDFPMQTATGGYPPGPLSPDGRLLPIRRGEATVLWDLAKKEVILKLPGLNGIRSFSDDGSLFLATGLLASGMMPHLCDLKTFPPVIRIFPDLPKGWICRTLSPDGKWFVAGGALVPGLRLYSTADFSVAMDYNPPESTSQWDAAWSQDSRYLLISSHTGKVTCWSPLRPDPVWTLEAHAGGVSTPAFFNNNSGMATLGNDGLFKLWNLTTLQAADAIPMTGLSLEGTRDGSMIFADDSLRRERPVFTCQPPVTAQSVKIPPASMPNPYYPGKPWVQGLAEGGGFILTAGHDLHFMDADGLGFSPGPPSPQNDALAWDGKLQRFFRVKGSTLSFHVADGTPIGEPVATPAGTRLAFDPVSRRLVAGSSAGFQLWSIPEDNSPAAHLPPASLGLDPSATVSALTWSKTGRWLAWSGTKSRPGDPKERQEETWVIDTATLRGIQMALPPQAVSSLAFADGGSCLLAATSTHVFGMAVATGAPRWSLPHQRLPATPPCLSGSPGSGLIALTLSQESISLIHAETGHILYSLTHPVACTVRAIDFNATGTRLAVIAGHFVQTWNLEAIRATLITNGMENPIPPPPRRGAHDLSGRGG